MLYPSLSDYFKYSLDNREGLGVCEIGPKMYSNDVERIKKGAGLILRPAPGSLTELSVVRWILQSE